MAKLLVVDDEEKIRSMIRKYAQFEGYEVEEAIDGFDAIEKVSKNNFDLIIMDIMMPDFDGFSACKEIRKSGNNAPIIMLSARGEEDDKAYGFELGIDDYVVKPFSVKELMLRIAAILKRTGMTKNETINLKGLNIDASARIVKVNDEVVDLSPKEYELLLYFVQHPNVAITRETLIREVWGYDYFGDDRTLDTHIKLLRKALGEYQNYIVTLRGVGYRFEGKSE